MPIGCRSASVKRVATARPERQSGSKIASAAMMQCCALRQASRKLGFSCTVSLRAL